MTNICTKVTVRKRPIKNGQTSLYLDFYPPIRNPEDRQALTQGVPWSLHLHQPC